MATTYSTRFYNSDGTLKLPVSSSHAALQGVSFSETIPTTVTDGTDEHYLFPVPAVGTRRFHGMFLTGGDMDTDAAPALNADIVIRTTLNGVVTDTIIYDSSAAGLFSAAIALKWVDVWALIANSDNGVGHVIFKVGTAAATPAAANLTVIPQWM